MTAEQAAAFIQAQAVAAQIEALGMAATNQERAHRGEPPVHLAADFEAIINRYGLHHNALVTWFGAHQG